MGKGVMFFGFIWLLTCLAGTVLIGDTPFASTKLSQDISANTTTITVVSTTGFPAPGIITIQDERIAYSSITSTTFKGNFARPLERGVGDTDNTYHSSGSVVRTLESSMLNSSLDYNLAIISDAAGAQAFLSVPTAVFNIILAFGRSPFSFLGTDLQILTAVWAVAFLGLIVSFFIQIAGGRRV